MKVYAGAIDRSGAVDGHDECRKQYGCAEQRSNDRSKEGQECAVVLGIDHAMHEKSSESRKCTARLFQAYSPKNNARLVVVMLEVLAFPLDTNDVVNCMETMERKINEFERYANIEILEFLKIGIVIRQAEDAFHHELAQVGNIPRD